MIHWTTTFTKLTSTSNSTLELLIGHAHIPEFTFIILQIPHIHLHLHFAIICLLTTYIFSGNLIYTALARNSTTRTSPGMMTPFPSRTSPRMVTLPMAPSPSMPTWRVGRSLGTPSLVRKAANRNSGYNTYHAPLWRYAVLSNGRPASLLGESMMWRDIMGAGGVSEWSVMGSCSSTLDSGCLLLWIGKWDWCLRHLHLHGAHTTGAVGWPLVSPSGQPWVIWSWRFESTRLGSFSIFFSFVVVFRDSFFALFVCFYVSSLFYYYKTLHGHTI